MNNPYMWTPPYCMDRAGFNSPPRPNWSPLSAPVPHMAPPRGPRFLSMYQSYPNHFCHPPPPMVNPQSPARFAQFPPNRNIFSNKNQQSNPNQSSHSLQHGSFQPSNHKQIPYQTDKKIKKLGNQNQHVSSESQKEKNIKKKKKNKPNKRDLPENCAFYCDVCDRGFKTEEKLKEHTDGHEKCKEEGCSYIAAPKLVQLHVQNHHYTGLAKKIWSVESQEDIAKWIKERKKNFPTAANIEKKKALEAEKKARGEVLNEKQFYHRPNDQRQKHKGHYRPWGKKRKFNDCFAEDVSPEKITEKEKDEVNNKQICDKRETDEPTESSDPLSTILTTNLVTFSNNADSNEENKSTSKSLSLPSSLKALQTIYKSDEDDVNDVNANENLVPSTESQCNMTILKEWKNSCNHHQRSENQVRLQEAQELARRPWHSKVFKRDRPTLLEKLLAKEIRHERNVILQCIHYIVKNNFFDKPNFVCPNQ